MSQRIRANPCNRARSIPLIRNRRSPSLEPCVLEEFSNDWIGTKQ